MPTAGDEVTKPGKAVKVMLSFTLGAGRKEPQGSRVDLDGSPVHAVSGFYAQLPTGLESWVSPHVFEGNYREQPRWISSAGVIIDVDYDAPADVFPDNDEISELINAVGRLPGNFYHLTPHGVRLACIFPEQCSDRDLVQRATRGACELTAKALGDLPYKVDRGATNDLARFFYTPRCHAKGVQRDYAIVSLAGRTVPYAPRDLAAHAPTAPPPVEKGKVTVIRSATFDAAAQQWVLDHTTEYPKAGTGECPICGHKECFGQFPDDPLRWYCFSSNHTTGAGVKTDKGYHGDALDIEAHARGCKAVDVVRTDGYLAAAERAVESQAQAKAEQDKITRPWRARSYLTAVGIITQNERDILEGRALECNDMTGDVELGRKPIRDSDVHRIRQLIEARFVGGHDKGGGEVGLQVSAADVFAAVDQVARSRPFHPVREYLEGLKWDGVERISHVADELLGAEDNTINRAIVKRFFISAVARPLSPGCKVDTVPILVGKQGALKSSFFRVLAGSWFVDTVIDISSDSTRAYMSMRKAWILEWAELESLFRARDSSSVKAFLSSPSDTYIPKYGRYSVEVKRQGVIVGTINPEEFLTDDTGHRRFWPIRVGDINLAHVSEQRDQLWAEAVALFRAGEQWWLTPSEECLLAPAHDDHRTRDAWEGPVFDWLAKQGLIETVTVQEILTNALSMPKAQWTDRDMKRVARALRDSGEWSPDPNKPKGKPRLWTRTGTMNRGEKPE